MGATCNSPCCCDHHSLELSLSWLWLAVQDQTVKSLIDKNVECQLNCFVARVGGLGILDQIKSDLTQQHSDSAPTVLINTFTDTVSRLLETLSGSESDGCRQTVHQLHLPLRNRYCCLYNSAITLEIVRLLLQSFRALLLVCL